MPPVSPIRLCVVGNGWSPIGHGPWIDGHDFVVRCTSCVTAHKRRAGWKTSAWAWFGNASLWPGVYQVPGDASESWFVLPRSGKRFHSEAYAYAQKLSANHGMRFRAIHEPIFSLAKSVLKIQPSTGFLAILMALHVMHPAKMTVIGMDATLPTKPGWDEPNPVRKWKTDGRRVFGHNFVREKELLAASIAAKRFGPMFWETDIEWVKL
jgi:hypothetical protein